MKASICFCAIFIIASLVPVEVSAQGRRYVVVSSRVGVVIDSQEATTYKLFGAIKDFHSASVYQAPDSTLWVVAQLRSAEGILRDSTFAFPFVLLQAYAEQIDHWDEILQGTYQMGASQPHILCDDGTPLNPPPVASTETAVSTDALPLVPNTSRLSRPIFETVHFEIAIGLSVGDFSQLQTLIGNVSNVSCAVSFFVHVPVLEAPSISFLGGLGFAPGRSLYSWSTFVLYRPGTLSFFDVIFGLGAGQTRYEYSGEQAIIKASQLYPVLLLGLNIVANTLDIVFTYPLTKGLSTTFESKSYTVKPAGFGLSLLLSL
jgi:hypothetical protein